MKKKFRLYVLLIPLVTLYGCNKDDDNKPQGSFSVGITDTRVTQKSTGNIIDAQKLTKFEITISKIELKSNTNGNISVLNHPATVDLRNYQGKTKELSSLNIPLGSYDGIIISLSGVSITYSGNNYMASVGSTASVSLSDIPGITFTAGIPNPFQSEQAYDISYPFEINEELNTKDLTVSIDAVSSCYEIEYVCTAGCTGTQYFAGIRTAPQILMYFKEGIQQIKHSPPLGIELNSGATSANYYGIHTFIDFKGIGGEINSHTSQHVYRGEDGTLLIDAENMVVNNTTLTPSSINATGQTDVRADEVFDFKAISDNLKSKGHTLVGGNTYYFSLRKTWNITSTNDTYSYTRMCEPIPVLWPVSF